MPRGIQNKPATSPVSSPVAPSPVADGAAIPNGAMPGWSVTLPDGSNLLLVLDMDEKGNVSNLFAIIPSLPYVATGEAFNQ